MLSQKAQVTGVLEVSCVVEVPWDKNVFFDKPIKLKITSHYQIINIPSSEPPTFPAYVFPIETWGYRVVGSIFYSVLVNL